MSLTLYFAAGSPPSRACLLLIRTLKLDVKVKHVNLAAGEQNSPEFLKLNPLHKVPVLTDGDFVLTEGRAILGYLVNKFSAGSDLYPNDPQKRARIDQRLYYDASVVFDSVAQIVVAVLFKRAKKIPTELREKVADTLSVLESFLSDANGWFSGGEKISIADISILPSVTTLKEFGYDLSRHPKLNDWYLRCQSLPGFDENLDGAKYLAERFFSVLDNDSL